MTSKEIGDGELDNEKSVVLLIHGIFGDTTDKVDAFFDPNWNLYRQFDTVLAFDYENLNTPIEETARELKSRFEKAGLFNGKGRRLTIVAHSMGGLYSGGFLSSTKMERLSSNT